MTVLSQNLGSARLVLIQATVLVIVFLVLAITPAPVTFPNGTWELVLLLKGAGALLLTDVILGGASGDKHTIPVRHVTSRLLRGASNPHRLDHYHVQDTSGTIGIVEEVLADRQDAHRAIVVTGGSARHRFLINIEELQRVDHDERTITVNEPLGG
jgi:hypothetical protein